MDDIDLIFEKSVKLRMLCQNIDETNEEYRARILEHCKLNDAMEHATIEIKVD